MSSSNALYLIRDASNTLRSFFGTNILFMAWALSQLGALLGPVTTLLCAFAVYRATLCLLRTKHSLPRHELVVSYGGVLRAVGGWRGKLLVDVLVGLTQFLTCVSYIAFSSKNLHNLSRPHLSFEVCISIVASIACLGSCFHSPFMLAKLSIVTNTMMLTGISVIFTLFDLRHEHDVALAIPLGLPIGAATLSSALGGITTVLDVERTMTDAPGRYERLLSVVLPCAVIFLTTVGTLGYLTFGSGTCSVLSLSIPDGTWQQIAAQTALTIGPGFESILNSFPLFVILEDYATRFSSRCQLWTSKYPLLSKSLYRFTFFLVFAFIAHGVPFIGQIAAINGAVGYASMSFLVPVAAEWLRSRQPEKTKKVPFPDAAASVPEPQCSAKNTHLQIPPTAEVETEAETNRALCHSHNLSHCERTHLLAEDLPFAAYRLTRGRKVELLCIFVFGLFVVIAGSAFAVKNIVEKVAHSSSASNSTTC